MNLALNNWIVLLEYCKLLASWPVITVICVLYVLRKFSEEIKKLVNRVATVKFPGGEITTQQEAALNVESEGMTSAIAEELPLDDKGVRSGDAEAILVAARLEARLWEFRYLNFFFAPNTQNVLEWMENNNILITLTLFNSFWMGFVPDGAERDAIILALKMHELIVVDGVSIALTGKGKGYLNWPGRRKLAPNSTITWDVKARG